MRSFKGTFASETLLHSMPARFRECLIDFTSRGSLISRLVEPVKKRITGSWVGFDGLPGLTGIDEITG